MTDPVKSAIGEKGIKLSIMNNNEVSDKENKIAGIVRLALLSIGMILVGMGIEAGFHDEYRKATMYFQIVMPTAFINIIVGQMFPESLFRKRNPDEYKNFPETTTPDL